MDDTFDQERLESVVVENAALPARALLDAISSEVTRYTAGGKQFDDITLVSHEGEIGHGMWSSKL